MFSLTTIVLGLGLSAAGVEAVPQSRSWTRAIHLFARQGDGIPPQCTPMCYGPVNDHINSCIQSSDYPTCFCDADFLKGFQSCIDCTVSTDPPADVMSSIEDAQDVIEEALRTCAAQASSSFGLQPVTVPAPPVPSSASVTGTGSRTSSASARSSPAPAHSVNSSPLSRAPNPPPPIRSTPPSSSPSPTQGSGNAASALNVGASGFWATSLGIIVLTLL